ncbi:MAG: hypothetical protein AMDU1_APLC00016G0010 [Thermoplasmatales archaeon A-plasma]|nr:MAG: hypothetical protein AMDU1_APLC00016G0010 [Thermoplasmatales archaeon A-plasma]
MNKKLLVMALVPVLVVMSGALAFSAFTGTVTTDVTASSATFSLSEAGNVALYNATNTVVTITGANGVGMTTAGVAPLEQLGTISAVSGSSEATFSVSVNNLAPGDFVSLIFAINNTGTSAVNLGAMSFSGVGSLWVPATFSSTNGVVATTSGDAGFAYGGLSEYAIYPGNAYTTSSTYEPSGILAPGGTAVFWFYVGLTSNAGNNYVGQTSGTLTLTASVTSAA